jgi:MoxR-like ATPase
MDDIVGLMGRDEQVADLVAEIRKGKHVILTGPVGIVKSAVLREALKRAPINLLQLVAGFSNRVKLS